MACDIASDMGKESFTALCVLKGGYQFFSDLLQMIRQIYRFSSLYAAQSQPSPFHIRAEFIRVKSYENDASTGNVRITGIEDLESLRGQVSHLAPCPAVRFMQAYGRMCWWWKTSLTPGKRW